MQAALKIRAWRRYRGLKALSLAARAGVSPQTISTLENGGKARESTIAAIAQALDVRPEDLANEPPRPQIDMREVEQISKTGRIITSIALMAANDYLEIPPLLEALQKIQRRSHKQRK